MRRGRSCRPQIRPEREAEACRRRPTSARRRVGPCGAFWFQARIEPDCRAEYVRFVASAFRQAGDLWESIPDLQSGETPTPVPTLLNECPPICIYRTSIAWPLAARLLQTPFSIATWASATSVCVASSTRSFASQRWKKTASPALALWNSSDRTEARIGTLPSNHGTFPPRLRLRLQEGGTQ